MTKKAVLVGINAYDEVNRLEGCVNDVEDMYTRLTQTFGFQADNVRMLLDARATRAAILERLEWLVRDAHAGDELVFHFSGHGTQIRDWNGDELEDHLDEALVPVDYDWLDKSLIVDDDLLKIFSKAKAANLTAILDCCHSGTGTRVWTPGPKAGRKILSARQINPPRDVAARARGRDLPGWTMLAVEEGMTHLCIAACQSAQTAADAAFGMDVVRPNGALTYYLANVVLPTPGHTWLDVMAGVKDGLASDGFEQVPRLEGPAARINGYPFGGVS